MSVIRIYPYAPLRAITTWTVISQCVKLAALGLLACLVARALIVGDPIDYTSTADTTNTDTGPLIARWLVIALINGPDVVSLIWFYRAAGNTRALSLPTLKPTRAVGWFFVPFANLCLPYLYMRDIWVSALDLHEGRRARDALPVTVWWCCVVVGGLFISFGSDPTALESPDPVRDGYLMLVGSMFSWAGSLLFLRLVLRISRWRNAEDTARAVCP